MFLDYITVHENTCHCSFCFLLWGLSAVASSINLLVLKFMTISLEEEEQGEDELHEMGANIVTLDEEVRAAAAACSATFQYSVIEGDGPREPWQGYLHEPC